MRQKYPPKKKIILSIKSDLYKRLEELNQHTHCDTVDPVTNNLASARQKKSLVTESRWSQL